MINYYAYNLTYIVFFAIIYLPLSIYALRKVYNYLNLRSYKRIANITSISLFIIFPLCVLSQAMFDNAITKNLYYFSFTLVGAMLYLAILTLIIELIKYLLNKRRIQFKNRKYWAYIIIAVTFIAVISSFINTLTYKETTVTINTPKITRDIRLTQISDVHIFGANQEGRFESIYKMVVNTHPDIILITGDLFDIPGEIPSSTIRIINDYNIPVLYVYGNHETYYGEDKAKAIVDTTHTIILDNNKIEYNDLGLTFIGLNDSEDRSYIKKMIPTIGIDSNNYNILLNHRPIDAKDASDYGIDLMISGHTHAGQFFPKNLIDYIIYPYNKGEYRVGNMQLFVSQGVGYWALKLRNFSRNEIAVFDLKKE